MITVKNINGAPESKPERFVGVHSDEDFFYFFETQEEVEAHTAQIEAESANDVPVIPATDIPSLLKSQTPEQIAEIKQILGL